MFAVRPWAAVPVRVTVGGQTTGARTDAGGFFPPGNNPARPCPAGWHQPGPNCWTPPPAPRAHPGHGRSACPAEHPTPTSPISTTPFSCRTPPRAGSGCGCC
ncbi:MAG: hypothetical protein WKG07_19980 [Hymenobacter sp.]